MGKAGLAFGCYPLPGHPAEQTEELTAVADASGKGVGPVVKCIEHGLELLIESDGIGQALG
jgi:hypothetical protein